MSKHFGLFLILSFAPFVAYWSFQLGEITSNRIFNEPIQPLTIFPEHFAWYAVGVALGTLALLGGLFESLTERIIGRRI